jgi:hypothetical protein
LSQLQCSYVIPVRWSGADQRVTLTAYLAEMSGHCTEVIVVDGSNDAVFRANAKAWGDFALHLRPEDGDRCLNGKVAGVKTGIRRASNERVILADDDVRYDETTLRRAVELLDRYDLVRPQNYFAELPWHARWDTARTLLNRCLGRDFPGTLAIRRGRMIAMGYYDGDVLFENFELIRTVQANGGRVASPLDLYVARCPPSSSHFWSQRVRQAYDDFALPLRMLLWLSIPPLLALAAARRKPRPALALSFLSMIAAECGRRRAGGARVFPITSSVLAPVWLLERGICSWLALGRRLRGGGVHYAGSVITTAANSKRELRRRSNATLEPVHEEPSRLRARRSARRLSDRTPRQ